MLFGCARSLGVQVGLENTGHFGEPFMFEALESLAEIPGLCSHGYRAQCSQPSSDQPALDRHNDRIAHIHLHDSDGGCATCRCLPDACLSRMSFGSRVSAISGWWSRSRLWTRWSSRSRPWRSGGCSAFHRTRTPCSGGRAPTSMKELPGRGGMLLWRTANP